MLDTQYERRYVPSFVFAVRLFSGLLHKHPVFVDIQVDGLYQSVKVESSAPALLFADERNLIAATHSVCFSVEVRPK
jgi:hypothetical protein